MAGNGDDTTRPTIVSITPDDGDSGVERDVTITVEFSEPIDPSTITGASVVLEGPDGDGRRHANVDGNILSFAPDEPLVLLGAYALAIDDTIADRSGNNLARAEGADFQVRDGEWSAPAFPFGRSIARTVMGFQKNSLGDAVVGMYHS
jgi:hypothetical protein